jgi:hypothetical protein
MSANDPKRTCQSTSSGCKSGHSIDVSQCPLLETKRISSVAVTMWFTVAEWSGITTVQCACLGCVQQSYRTHPHVWLAAQRRTTESNSHTEQTDSRRTSNNDLSADPCPLLA